MPKDFFAFSIIQSGSDDAFARSALRSASPTLHVHGCTCLPCVLEEVHACGEGDVGALNDSDFSNGRMSVSRSVL